LPGISVLSGHEAPRGSTKTTLGIWVANRSKNGGGASLNQGAIKDLAGVFKKVSLCERLVGTMEKGLAGPEILPGRLFDCAAVVPGKWRPCVKEIARRGRKRMTLPVF